MERLSQRLLSASALADMLQGLDPQDFKHEYLVWQGIPDDAVVTVLPSSGGEHPIKVHLGRMKVPGAICDEAGGWTEEIIHQWAVQKTLSYHG